MEKLVVLMKFGLIRAWLFSIGFAEKSINSMEMLQPAFQRVKVCRKQRNVCIVL